MIKQDGTLTNDFETWQDFISRARKMPNETLTLLYFLTKKVPT